MKTFSPVHALLWLRYVLEALVLFFAFAFFRLLSVDNASALGGVLGRFIGPFTRAHRTASNNLQQAMPELSDTQRAVILRQMWDNLGRSVGEYPHLARPLMRRRIAVEGMEHLRSVRRAGKGALFVSGHFANLEIAPLTAALYDMPLLLIYRAANNPLADWLICRIRARYNHGMAKKGRRGAARALTALQSGQSVGMLIDQKMNDGVSLRFFGRPAMTATAATRMAIKTQVPLLAARVVRTDGAHFHVTIDPPIVYAPDADPTAAMQQLYDHFEHWIRETPAQWFWVHRRW